MNAVAIPTKRDYALALAAAGYRIVPLPPDMKAPPPSGWPDLATNDAARVAQWWTAQPQANVAIVGGHGLLLLDVDTRKGGDASLAALEAKHGKLPVTLTALTPSGGRHHYYAGPDVDNSGSKIGLGLDIKSRGGYVVAPPSFTIALPGKQSEGYYRWADLTVPIVSAPTWLIDVAGASKAANDGPSVKLREATPQQWQDIRSALDHLVRVPEVASNKLWSDIGYTLLCLGDEGRELFCEWSARAPGYDLGAPEAWWGSHSAERARSDFRTLFTIAGKYGWVNPNPAGDPGAIEWGTGPLPAGASATPISSPAPSVPAPAAARFALVDAWDFADGPDPQWRIEGLLPEQGLAMVFGASGSGKTFFVLDLSMAIALGVQCYGHDKRRVQPGRVVYIVAEGAGGFRKRLRAYREYHQLSRGSPAPKLVTVTPNFMSVADVTELQAVIVAAGGADVIVIDTLHASSAGADENSAKDMGLFLGHCRVLQAATGGLVIMVHHSGKDEERGARGSSALRAAMDTEIEVSGAAGAEFSVAHVTKQRDGDTAGSVCFKIVAVPLFGARPAVSAAVEHIESPVKVRKPRASDEQSLAADMVRESYPNGVQLEVLVSAIQVKRPDMRPDNIRRSITRTIDAKLLTIDKAQNVRLTQGA